MTGSNTYFCANGIIAADRKVHPSAYEVKKVYAEMKVIEKDLEKKEFTVKNKHLFTDLSEFDLKWTVTANGKEIESGIIDNLSVPPLSSKDITVPFSSDNLPNAECIITFSFLCKNKERYCEKGYEQSFDQIILKKMPEALPDNSKGKLQCVQIGTTATVQGENFTVKVTDGKIVSLRFDGKEYLKTPLKPNYFRALIDNDFSLTNFVPFLIPLHPYYTWRTATDTAQGTITAIDEGANGEIIIYVDWAVFSFSGVKSKYTIYPDGKIEVNHEGTPKAFTLLRFGTQMGLIPELNYVKWYGRGPQETYIDRKTGGKIAIHEMSVDDLEHHYMRPQENGNRVDVRYVEITDKDGNGLKFTALYNTPLAFSAWHYTQNELEKATHIHELKHKDITTFNFDLTQLGVGGDMPGDAHVREPYILHPNKKYAYSFTIESIKK